MSRALHSLVGASGFLGFLLLAAMADCPSVVPEFFRRRRRRVFGLLSGVEPSEEIAFAHSMLGLGRASWGVYACCARSKVSRYTMLTSPVSQDRRRLPSSTGCVAILFGWLCALLLARRF